MELPMVFSSTLFLFGFLPCILLTYSQEEEDGRLRRTTPSEPLTCRG